MFGGLWQPSTLSYAVEQFFENGGRRAVIVRVVNGGGPASITLPCSVGEALTLVAVSPGSRESLRASVDFDNIGANEPDRFNLVLQRVRSAGSEHIEDQEIFRRLSVTPGTPRYVTVRHSRNPSSVRVKVPFPSHAAGADLSGGIPPSGRLCRFESGWRRRCAPHGLRPDRLAAGRLGPVCAGCRGRPALRVHSAAYPRPRPRRERAPRRCAAVPAASRNAHRRSARGLEVRRRRPARPARVRLPLGSRAHVLPADRVARPAAGSHRDVRQLWRRRRGARPDR